LHRRESRESKIEIRKKKLCSGWWILDPFDYAQGKLTLEAAQANFGGTEGKLKVKNQNAKLQSKIQKDFLPRLLAFFLSSRIN